MKTRRTPERSKAVARAIHEGWRFTQYRELRVRIERIWQLCLPVEEDVVHEPVKPMPRRRRKDREIPKAA